MTDRLRDVFVWTALGVLSLALPDLSIVEGRVALALAATLVLGATALLIEGGVPGNFHRFLLLSAVLFLAVQPFAAPAAEIAPIPARVLILLGISLVFWVHMNIQSVSGKLTWKFSRLDVAVLGACGLTVLGSLGLLWYLGDAGQVVSQIVLQSMAITVAVLYLYFSRWQPARGGYLMAIGITVVVLLAGFWTAAARGVEFQRAWSKQQTAWRVRVPTEAEVGALVRSARLAAPTLEGRIVSEASLAATSRGAYPQARRWLESATRQDPQGRFPALAGLDLAGALGQIEAMEHSITQLLSLQDLEGPMPGFPPLSSGAAIEALVGGLNETGRWAEALAWLHAPPADLAADTLCRLQADSLAGLGRDEEAQARLEAPECTVAPAGNPLRDQP